MDWSYILILGIGLVSSLMAVWIWRGRGAHGRSWVHIPVVGDLASLMGFPSFGAISVGGALGNLGAPDWVSIPILLAGFVPVVWGFPILVVSLFYWPAQRLWGPAWYTSLSKDQVTQIESRQADILAIGAGNPPRWAGNNLDYWFCRQLGEQERTPGHLWLNEHGVFFDPRSKLPANVLPARTTWRNLQRFERKGRRLTVTFKKWNAPVTHTFSMPRLRARRAEKHILEQYGLIGIELPRV